MPEENRKENYIKKLVKDYSIETTPNVYQKFGSLKEMLPNKNDIYVTYLPDENPKRVIETSKQIVDEGLTPIPHLPARTIKDISSLENYIGSLSEKAGCKKILIIGGGGKQLGNISSSLDVLKTDLLSKYNFKFVGVAGHPDGNSDIKQNDLDYAIIEKNKVAKNSDFKMYIATQFFFESKSFKNWEKHLNSIGNELDIHAGIPGPATLKTLILYAKSCGIANSIKFLSKQALNITKLTSTREPDKLILDLCEYKFNSDQTKLKKLHLYAFGGMKKTSTWMNDVIEKPLEIIHNKGFKIVD